MSSDVRILAQRDPFAAALLPVLLHGLNNATQVLSSLNALLALDEDGSVLTSRAGDLAHASRQVDDLGWLLALVGSASGADVLMARRERAGLAPLVACVRTVLRKDGRDLSRPERSLPGLATDVADGWQLPWTIGSWLWTSGRSLAPGGTGAKLEWEIAAHEDAWELRCDAPWSTALEAIAQRLPGLEAARAAPDASVLRIPLGWLTVEQGA
jgi:hypothetical protein